MASDHFSEVSYCAIDNSTITAGHIGHQTELVQYQPCQDMTLIAAVIRHDTVKLFYQTRPQGFLTTLPPPLELDDYNV